jgi:hypothetical protein
MRALILALPFALASAAMAQDSAPVEGEGFDLMEEGAELILRGLMDEMGPAIDEFRDLAETVGPAFANMSDEMGAALVQLFGQIDDIANYELPEMLENGDIIIRRRPDAPPVAEEPPVTEPLDL